MSAALLTNNWAHTPQSYREHGTVHTPQTTSHVHRIHFFCRKEKASHSMQIIPYTRWSVPFSQSIHNYIYIWEVLQVYSSPSVDLKWSSSMVENMWPSLLRNSTACLWTGRRWKAVGRFQNKHSTTTQILIYLTADVRQKRHGNYTFSQICQIFDEEIIDFQIQYNNCWLRNTLKKRLNQG